MALACFVCVCVCVQNSRLFTLPDVHTTTTRTPTIRRCQMTKMPTVCQWRRECYIVMRAHAPHKTRARYIAHVLPHTFYAQIDESNLPRHTHANTHSHAYRYYAHHRRQVDSSLSLRWLGWRCLWVVVWSGWASSYNERTPCSCST